MKSPFWNLHNGGRLRTTHYTFCYFVMCFPYHPIWPWRQWNIQWWNMGFSIFFGNIFIIDKHNGNVYQISNWILMMVGNPNFSNTYLFLARICSTQNVNLITSIIICYDKESFVGVTVGHCGDCVIIIGYGPHYISDTKRFP